MIIDTDVLIRFLTDDQPKKAAKFEIFLKSGKKGKVLDVTIAEIYWVLSSVYKFKKDKILLSLESLIRKKNIICQKEVMSKTISLLRKSNLSFIDAYIAARSLVKEDGRIMSYDHGFSKIKGIKRLEP